MNVTVQGSELPPGELQGLRLENAKLREMASAVASANAHAAELMVELEEARDEISAANTRMADILDNVEFGFLIVGPDHLIGEQVTASCWHLLGTTDVAGRKLEAVLTDDHRLHDHLSWSVDDVFSDIMPEELTLAQLPKRIPLGDRVLGLTGRALRDESGGVRAILFSIADITALEAHERETAHNRAIIKILRQRESFDQFVEDLHSLLAVAHAAAARRDETTIRRVLHTIKGNCAIFGLSAIAQVVHELEERACVDEATLRTVDSAIAGFFSRCSDVIDAEWPPVAGRQRELRITEAQLAELLNAQGREDVARWAAEIRKVPAGRILGPVDDLVHRLGARLEKPVTLEVTGADVLVDDRLAPVLGQVGHLLRNAVVHGIEAPGERSQKPEVAKVTLSIAETDAHFEVAVTDDGVGIDTDALGEVAVARGLLSRVEVGNLSSEDKRLLVFADGVSTAERVSHDAGRGVGMAAVRQAVEAAGGTLKLHSERGRGTRVELRVPKIDAPRETPKRSESPAPPTTEHAAHEGYDAQFIIASGPEDTYRATLGLAAAISAASSGTKVVCFFTMRGAKWTGDADPQETPVPGFPRVKEFIEMLVEEGVRMEACTSCVENHLDAPRDADGRKQLAKGFVFAGLPEAAIRMGTVQSTVF